VLVKLAIGFESRQRELPFCSSVLELFCRV
jgi:hypothetical protein